MTEVHATPRQPPPTTDVDAVRVRRGVACAVTTAVTFGLAGPIAKAMTEAGWTSGAIVFFRCLVAAAILAVPAIRALRATHTSLIRHWRLVVPYGGIAVLGCQLSYVEALTHLSVSVTLLIEYSAPLLVIAYLWLRYGQRPGRRTAVGSATALAGLALLLDLTSDVHLSEIGLIWATSATCCTAVYFILNATTDGELPAVALAFGGLVLGAVGIAALSALGQLPWRTSMQDVPLGQAALPPALLVLAIGGALTALPYMTAIGAGRLLGPRLASFFAMSEVLAATIFAWVLLDQTPAPIQALGGVILLAGVVLIKLEPRVAQPTRLTDPT